VVGVPSVSVILIVNGGVGPVVGPGSKKWGGKDEGKTHRHAMAYIQRLP